MTSDIEFFKSIGINLDDSSKHLTKEYKEKSEDNFSNVQKLSSFNSIKITSLALTAVAASSIVVGFFGTLALVKKKNGTALDKALLLRRGMNESATKLAFRALGWGSFYALSGFSVISFMLYQFTKYNNKSDE